MCDGQGQVQNFNSILTVCVSSPKAKHSLVVSELVVTYLHAIMIPLIEMVGNKMIFRFKKNGIDHEYF